MAAVLLRPRCRAEPRERGGPLGIRSTESRGVEVTDQVHTAGGLTCLRFTWAQVASEPAHVQATLKAVTRRVTLQA
jgi:hypothetical protein